MTANPKGLFVYRVLVTLPAAGACFDGLSADDSAWLRAHLLALPRLFFVSRPDLREAFERPCDGAEAQVLHCPVFRHGVQGRNRPFPARMAQTFECKV